MKKLTLAMALAALLASPAFAQTSGAGQDRAETSKPPTAADKAAAKAARKTEGKAVAKAAKAGDAEPGEVRAARPATREQRKSAAAARKAEGAKVTRGPKDASGPN